MEVVSSFAGCVIDMEIVNCSVVTEEIVLLLTLYLFYSFYFTDLILNTSTDL